MTTKNCTVMVFAKAPVPGEVKTRLIPSLGAAGAAALQEYMVQRALTTATEAAVGPVELWCAPSSDHPFFWQCADEFGVHLCNQSGGDLGERLAYAFQQTLATSPYAVAIGADSPSLTAADLQEAATALKQGADAVIGPAEDGGYVLLGLSRYAPTLFSDVHWGSELVLDETRARLRLLGWRWHELPARWDVDRPEDVARLAGEGDNQSERHGFHSGP